MNDRVMVVANFSKVSQQCLYIRGAEDIRQIIDSWTQPGIDVVSGNILK